jgi:tetratricopeptide (TPR) repeat protein
MNHIAFYLRRIYFQRLTGQLIFKRGSVEKHLFFQSGELVHAKTNVPEERLGEILFKLGKISDEAHSQMERYIEPKEEIGKSLIKKGLTSQRNVDDGLAYQMREIALGLFPHMDGSFRFEEQPSLAERDFSTRINVPYLIEDGIRRMKFPAALQKMLEKRLPFVKDATFAHLLTEEEKQMLGRIKDNETAESLWRSLKYNPEFFWKTLYLFYCLNLVDFRDKEEVPAGKEEEKVSTRATIGSEGTSEPARPDLWTQLEEVRAFKEKLETANYYQILGVAKTASEDEIKKAYFHLARKFHPDRFDRNVSPGERVVIEDVFDKITKAYRTLTSREQRQDYDVKMPAAGRAESGRDLAKKADLKFRQAKTLFGQGRYEDTLGLLEEVLRLNRTKGSYFLLLAMTESKIPSCRKKAEEHFFKAIELEPWNPENYVGLGILYKQEGLLTKATKQFQKALEYDDEHELALRELEGLTKGGKKGGLKGLFSTNIFGSKKK